MCPNTGTSGGGTAVTITGTGLSGTTSVLFGTAPAQRFTVNSTVTVITAVSPAQAAGLFDVTVQSPGGTSPKTRSERFTYSRGTPAVHRRQPGQWEDQRGDTVTITGTPDRGHAVYCSAPPRPRPSRVNATGPPSHRRRPGRVAGLVDVTVQSPGWDLPHEVGRPVHLPSSGGPRGTGRDRHQPEQTGSTAGGITVTITGTNLTGATAVYSSAPPRLRPSKVSMQRAPR